MVTHTYEYASVRAMRAYLGIYSSNDLNYIKILSNHLLILILLIYYLSTCWCIIFCINYLSIYRLTIYWSIVYQSINHPSIDAPINLCINLPVETPEPESVLLSHLLHFQVCLTSNVGRGFKVASYDVHPAATFHERRLPFTLSSDNLLLSGDRDLQPR